MTVDTPSGPGLDSPVGEIGPSSATPWTEFGAVAPVTDGDWLRKASGEVPPPGTLDAGATPVEPP